MKTKTLYFISFIILGLISSSTLAQDCNAYLPLQKGSSFEITSYNPKGKVVGRAEHTVHYREEDGDNLLIKVASKLFDKKDKELTTMQYEARCVDGVFQMQLSSISAESMAGAGMNTTIEGDFLDFPNDPKPGQQLGNGEIKVSINQMMTMTTRVTNRKVEKWEEITTPAGTFNCIKITYDIATKMVMNMQGSGAEWYAPGVGMVRSESYNKGGKMTGYSELTKLGL